MAGRALAFLLVADPRAHGQGGGPGPGGEQRGPEPGPGLFGAPSPLGAVPPPGERADRYTMRPGAWRRILEEQARMLGRFRELAERGLALVGENPRLREVRDLYAFWRREFPLLLAKLEEG